MTPLIPFPLTPLGLAVALALVLVEGVGVVLRESSRRRRASFASSWSCASEFCSLCVCAVLMSHTCFVKEKRMLGMLTDLASADKMQLY